MIAAAVIEGIAVGVIGEIATAVTGIGEVSGDLVGHRVASVADSAGLLDLAVVPRASAVVLQVLVDLREDPAADP